MRIKKFRILLFIPLHKKQSFIFDGNLGTMKLTIIVLITTLFIACSHKKSNFTITGKFEAAAGEKIELRKDSVNTKIVIDSAVISSDGGFILSGQIKAPGIYSLVAHTGEYIYLVIQPGDKIAIEITGISPIPDYYITGSFDSELIKKLVTRQNKVLSKIHLLGIEKDQAKDNPEKYFEEEKRIGREYKALLKGHKKYSIDFIRKHCGSLATILALEQQFGIYEKPFFDIYEDIEIFSFADSCLTANHPGSDEVKRLNHFVAVAQDALKNKNGKSKIIREGMPAPDIVLPNVEGDTVSLSALKGKAVVLLFWASFNTASIKYIKELTEIFSGKEDVALFYVSLDKENTYWKSTSLSLNLSEYNVCDFRYWDSEIVDRYNVRLLPSIYLIDEEGLIAGINVDINNLRMFVEDNETQ